MLMSFHLLSRRSQQRERLSASVLSICFFVCLSVSPSVAKMQKRFSQKLSNLEIWCLLTTYRKLCNWTFQKTHYCIPKIPDGWDPSSRKSTWRHLFLPRVPIWIKFRRLVKNDMSTAVIWSKSKPDIEFQYGGRSGEFNGKSSQSHLPHCRVQSPGEINVMIVPHSRV